MMLEKAIRFENSIVRVICSDRTFHPADASVQVAENTLIWRWGSVAVSLETDSSGVVHLSLTNDGPDVLHLRRICVEWPASSFAPKLDARDFVQLYHSRDFMKLSGIRPVHKPNEWSDPAESSGMLTVFSHRGNRSAILLGALPPYGDCFVDLPVLYENIHRDGAFGLAFHLQASRQIHSKGREVFAHLIVLEGDDGNKLLSDYADYIRGRLPERLSSGRRVTGWNSWDYYSGAVQARDMLDNTNAAKRLFGESLGYMIVDDGYECQWGVWESGWKFPDGLTSLCADIRAAGYEPGIWTAPLMVNVYTPLYLAHPDWFVGDAQGNVFRFSSGHGIMALLDITLPEVARHIEEQFLKLRNAGFSYYKIDFAQMLQDASTFAQGDIAHSGMIRKLFSVIRRAVGDDAYLLACGAPYEAVIGVADGHRTTGDIHHYWSHIRQNIRTMLSRWWMQGTIGNTDPDYAIVRCIHTTTDNSPLGKRMAGVPWGAGANWCSGREMNFEEAQTLLLACLLTGGDLILGDALDKLNAIGIQCLTQILSSPVRPGRPINMFDNDGDDFPIIVAEAGDRTLLAMFNLSDNYVIRKLPRPYAIGSSLWVEFWSNEQIEYPEGSEISLSPHSTKAWWV